MEGVIIVTVVNKIDGFFVNEVSAYKNAYGERRAINSKELSCLRAILN